MKLPLRNNGDPQENIATLTLSELYLKQGHLDKAIEGFQELLANDPQNLMLRGKLSEAVERQQKELMPGLDVSKVKKNESVPLLGREPDMPAMGWGADVKHAVKKKEDDSKFTDEDILQAMGRGSENSSLTDGEKTTPIIKNEPDSRLKSGSDETHSDKLSGDKTEVVRNVLAELGTVEGIMKCFLVDTDGIPVVSIGETGNNGELGKRAVTIFESTYRSVNRLRQGKLQQVLVTSENGYILLVVFSNFILTVLANSMINPGLLRLTLDSATKKLEKIL